ncbi:Ubiquitin fusion degradation protein 4 [Basidiobolus ranarum]|uniref:Ubiquitin fusion degradation protein 4 n=1 Tax=Basidiobolus ranarum TaxID=34480 RepID=A0ABR2VTS9_9FUNG
MGIDEDVAYAKQIGIGKGKMTRTMTNDPQDSWHFEFSIGDVAIDNEWTIYKAIHQYIKQSTDKSRNRWSSIYAIKYKKVYDPPKNLEMLQLQSSSFEEAAACTGYYDHKNVYSQILRLLRELHTLNTRCLEIHSQTSICGKSLAVLQPSNFINVKLTAKMNRQLEEPMIVVNSCLPNWCEYLTKEYSFLFPFETRYLYLQSTAFGCSRSIARYQNIQARSSRLDSRRDDLQPVLGRIQRQKVRISRPRILESAVKVMDLYGSLPSILEVEYFEEVGTGLGPTLEFYAAVSKEFCKRSLTLWRDDGNSSTSGSYATSSQGLFPRPRSELYFESENGIRILNLYKAMGKFVAKALFDTRIIDLPLNSIFFKIFLNPQEKIQTLSDIRQVDSGIGNSLEVISYFAREKQRILQDFALSEVQRQKSLRRIKYQGVSLEDICLDCTLPGYPDIELTENGANTPVNIQNVEEYLDAVIEYTVGSGVTKQIEAFRSGFDTVFPSKHLKTFSADELVMLFGQAEEDWSPSTLLDAIRADHGYTPDSLSIKYLVEIMSSFTSKERREFLRFVTGSPRLPIGGFKSLTPRFTVVCKPNELPLTPDDYLPSVMTCVNYLKMPNYTSQDVMKSKLDTAMKEGQGSFHLS